MTRDQLIWHGVCVLLAAAGMWLMLPRGRIAGRWTRIAGALLALAALNGFCWNLELGRLTPRLGESVFWALALVTIISAGASVTFRSPVYCAIWFAMTLLGTAGLFFFQGAQFLAVATMVVYAGAILVTFLFVLMLAQPEGHAYYDRVSWEAPLSALAGAVMVGLLTMTVSNAISPSPGTPGEGEVAVNSLPEGQGTKPPSPGTPGEGRGEGPPPSELHMAQLGAELFGRHLIAVEVAGTLLLAALVGAAAIVAQGRQAIPPGSAHHG
jgi:NADH-quinone oxidoreductase subunit J